MAVVHRITGEKIAANGVDGAAYFVKQSDAKRALRAYRTKLNDKKAGSGPEKVEIKGRDQLVAALTDAISYGASE